METFVAKKKNTQSVVSAERISAASELFTETRNTLYRLQGSRSSDEHPYVPIMWGFSSAGRAPALQAGGQRFDPANLHSHGSLAQSVRAPA